MRYVLSNTLDPYFNLATEEYLLKNTSDDIFMLWRSAPSVIVGKHQNALAEINYKYLIDNNITLARRLSGGGTVVHDMQNLNFTFIANGEDGKLIDFKKFISPIIEYLRTLGLEAWIGEKNDIRVGKLKISGNAEHVFKKRVLHHGTLLFNSDLEQLRQAIHVVPGKYFDKAVQSNRASVVNIADLLETNMTIDEFIEGLSSYVLDINSEPEHIPVDISEKETIQELANTKYRNMEWILGYSPKYLFKHKFMFGDKQWHVELKTEKGVIKEAQIMIDNTEQLTLNKNLCGNMHSKSGIGHVLLTGMPELDAAMAETLIYHFF